MLELAPQVRAALPERIHLRPVAVHRPLPSQVERLSVAKGVGEDVGTAVGSGVGTGVGGKVGLNVGSDFGKVMCSSVITSSPDDSTATLLQKS